MRFYEKARRRIVYAIKEAQGDDHPLILRLSGAELMDRYGGNTEDECFELMKMAGDEGVDMISVTVGWKEAPEFSIGRTSLKGIGIVWTLEQSNSCPIFR